MNILLSKIGAKLDLELVNSIGEKIGQTYISQLMDVVDDENIIIAAPIHESRLMLITNGTRIRVILLHEKYGLLSFTGSITGKERRENLIVFDVKINPNYETIQRRKYFRLDCNLNVQYRIHQEENAVEGTGEISSKGDYKKGLTRNISGCGAAIVIEEDIDKSLLIEVILNLTESVTIKTICRIIRRTLIENPKGKKYELGLYFEKISQKDQDALIKFIFDAQRLLLKNNIADKK